MQKDALFYMANLHPEIERMFSFYKEGKIEASQNAKKRALGILEHIMGSEEIKPAGREEWNVIKNFILGFENLNDYEQKILSRYAEPFASKFMNNYTNQDHSNVL